MVEIEQIDDEFADFPEKLEFLNEPHQYKVAHGGRGSGKSWGFARSLLLFGAQNKLRILCAREVQDSIKQSVHKLLKDQIQLLGLGSFYTVLDNEIRGLNGTEFAFTGLSSLTVETIKSFEGYDRCWVEEGQSITAESWDILDPTIRKDGAEIWISFNPGLETDPTYERFVTNPPPDTVCVEMNWRDNPWFNDLMEQKRLHCKKTDPEGYKNIWDGKCKPAVEGAIYYNEIQALEETGRICNIPYDPMLKVHLVMDLGWGDSLGIGFVQKNLSEIRIINYLEYHQTDLPTLSAELREMRLNWGSIWLPHDGFNKTLNAGGKSTYDIFIALQWDVKAKEEIIILPVEDGIRIARMLFPRCYFDAGNTNALHNPTPPKGQTVLTHRIIECLKRYHRKINKETKVATTPVHDEFSHGGDMFRYIAVNADSMGNEAEWYQGEDYSLPTDTCDGVTGY